MQMDLQGKTAIVTGGSKGYGAGIAQVLKGKGVQVWITGREEAALEETASRLGVEALRADVTSAADWDGVIAGVMNRAGHLDILVNNAGAGIKIAPLGEQSDDEITASIAVNLTGVILGCRRAAPIMQQQRSGTIINVSSVCARQAWPGFSVYSAAKAGLVEFSECLYVEMRPFGVRVTSLIPSWGATQFSEAVGLPPKPDEIARQCIQPAELGDVVATICSLPAHLAIQDMTLWPLVQEVVPL